MTKTNGYNHTITASIVGCGSIADVHASILAEKERVRLLSCCDLKQEQASHLAKKYGCIPYKSLRELIRAEKPDMLHICSPHYTHVPLSLYAIKNGINVLLEKPVASNPIETEVLQNELKNSKAQLAVCFQNRYNPSVLYAKSLLETGKAGSVIGARAFLTWHRGINYYAGSDWRGSFNTEGAGVLINQAIHTIDLLHYFLGKPTSVKGTVSNRNFENNINVEDTAEITLYYENDVKALFYASVGYSTDAAVFIELHCENMTVVIENESLYIKQDGKITTPELEIHKAVGKSYWGGSHKLLIDDFYEHVSKNEKFPIDSIEGSFALKTVFDVIRNSPSIFL